MVISGDGPSSMILLIMPFHSFLSLLSLPPPSLPPYQSSGVINFTKLARDLFWLWCFHSNLSIFRLNCVLLSSSLPTLYLWFNLLFFLSSRLWSNLKGLLCHKRGKPSKQQEAEQHRQVAEARRRLQEEDSSRWLPSHYSKPGSMHEVRGATELSNLTCQSKVLLFQVFI